MQQVSKELKEKLVNDLLNLLRHSVEDKRYLNHKHFEKFSIIQFKDQFGNLSLLATPTRVEMNTHGLMGVSTNWVKAYTDSMVNFAKNCNAEFDLKESNWGQRRMDYIADNLPPDWYNGLMRRKFKGEDNV